MSRANKDSRRCAKDVQTQSNYKVLREERENANFYIHFTSELSPQELRAGDLVYSTSLITQLNDIRLRHYVHYFLKLNTLIMLNE